MLDAAHADDRQRESNGDDAAGYELVAHGEGNERAQAPIVWRAVNRVVTTFDRLDRRQHLDAQIGREDHRDDPGDDEREPHDPENVAGVFAGRRAREADRQEAPGTPLDYNLCFECKLCVVACPVGAIKPDGYSRPPDDVLDAPDSLRRSAAHNYPACVRTTVSRAA